MNKHIFLCLVALLLSNTYAEAGEPVPLISEVRFGLVEQGVLVFSQHRRESGIGLNGDVVFGRPSFDFPYGIVRPTLGFGISLSGGTNRLYSTLQWEIEKSSFFFDLGPGLAVHDGRLHGDSEDEKHYGSRVLFYYQMSLGYAITQHYRLALFHDHMSNAYLAEPNNGLNTVGLRIGYRF
ncbi:MAG: acyloxyacyl hydrolase [Desulfobacterales bacterium]|jgi:lipid A 3-O-deacylase